MPELNLSASSWSEDRELEEECEGIRSSPTCAEVASKAPTATAATAPAATAEEGEDWCTDHSQHQHLGRAIFAIAPIAFLERVVYNVSTVQSIQGRSPPCGSNLIFAMYSFCKDIY